MLNCGMKTAYLYGLPAAEMHTSSTQTKTLDGLRMENCLTHFDHVRL